ncbi:MAG: hypothetical protein K9G38_03170 [Bacteroidales bacterium]|nr:hypothetical protein [Bacteroidales bacterium]
MQHLKVAERNVFHNFIMNQTLIGVAGAKTAYVFPGRLWFTAFGIQLVAIRFRG